MSDFERTEVTVCPCGDTLTEKLFQIQGQSPGNVFDRGSSQRQTDQFVCVCVFNI